MAESEKQLTVSNRLYDFASGLVGNRVLDLYLKYKGITILTSTTLVPIVLILGQQAFSSYLEAAKRGEEEQAGGDIHIPIIDQDGIGAFLKLAGLYTLPLTTSTLVPLGVVMMLYEMHQRKQLTGGGRVTDAFYDFANGLVGNRVLDIYLKYKGITMLNPYTLVPIALILGQQVFSDYLKHEKSGTRQAAGGRISPHKELVTQGGGRIRVPFIDDPLIGNYLKLAGLYTLPLQTSTLLPLGVLMVIYELYQKKGQLGGKIRYSRGRVGHYHGGGARRLLRCGRCESQYCSGC